MNKFFYNDSGMLCASIHKINNSYPLFYVWKRERREVAPPGNKHFFVGKYSDIEKATKAVELLFKKREHVHS